MLTTVHAYQVIYYFKKKKFNYASKLSRQVFVFLYTTHPTPSPLPSCELGV